MRFDALAAIFPLMPAHQLAHLTADIEASGLQEPIVLLDKRILDGRNRWLACQAARVKPRFVDFRGDDPVAFVLSANLHRRHLSESQRAMCAARLATSKHGQNRGPSGKFAARSDVPSQAQAAGMFNVSERLVRHARSAPDHAAFA
jgi:hypothetical protein